MVACIGHIKAIVEKSHPLRMAETRLLKISIFESRGLSSNDVRNLSLTAGYHNPMVARVRNEEVCLLIHTHFSRKEKGCAHCEPLFFKTQWNLYKVKLM